MDLYSERGNVVGAVDSRGEGGLMVKKFCHSTWGLGRRRKNGSGEFKDLYAEGKELYKGQNRM